jgi:hypothetical protein
VNAVIVSLMELHPETLIATASFCGRAAHPPVKASVLRRTAFNLNGHGFVPRDFNLSLPTLIMGCRLDRGRYSCLVPARSAIASSNGSTSSQGHGDFANL